MADNRSAPSWTAITLLLMALVICAVLISFTVAGEPRVGVLKGRVLDTNGNPIIGAYVTVPTVNKNESRHVRTDERGEWRAPQIPIGYHNITAQRRGYQPAHQMSGSVDEGKLLTVPDIILFPTKPNLQVGSYYMQSVMPGRRARLYLSGEWNAPEAIVRFEMYPYDIIKVSTLSYDEREQAKKEFLATAGRNAIKPVWSWERKYTTSDLNGSFSGEPLTPKLNRPGPYMVVASLGNLRAGEHINVTTIALVVKRDSTGVLAWTTDIWTGRPKSARVELYSGGQKQSDAVTDTDGMARLAFGSTHDAQIAARSGASVALATTYANQDDYGTDSLLYTDRPIYRPGHTVQFKGIFRKRHPGSFGVIAGRQVTFVVEDPEGGAVATVKAQTNANGTAAGSWISSEDAKLGRWRLKVELDGKTYDARFSIEEYRKPEYAVSVSIPKPHYIRGEKITASIRANYYFGAPAAGAEVNYVVYRSSFYFWDYESDFESWFDTETGDRGYDGGGYGEVVQEGKGTTDENGELKVDLDTGGEEEASRWVVEAHVIDATMREVSSEAGTNIVPADYTIQAQPECYVYKPGDIARIRVKTVDWEHNARPGQKLDIKIGRSIWTGRNSIIRPIATSSLTTDSKGQGVFTWKADVEGDIVIDFTGHDSSGRRTEGSAGVLVAREGYWSNEWTQPGQILTAVRDKKLYNKGDTARILITSRIKDANVLVSVEGEKLFESRLLQLNGSGGTVSVPVKSEYLPSVYIKCTVVSRGKITDHQTPLAISPESSFLTVKVNSSKGRYKPGEAVTYTIRTLDNKGRGVPAEVSFGVVDESIYALRADSTPDMQHFFWGPGQNKVYTTTSIGDYYAGGVDKFENKVRKYFPDTAYWNPFVVTDSKGTATVSFKMPDSLTTWRATARAVTSDTKVGSVIQKCIVTKDLIVRLQAPRFFRERDRQTLGLIVHNYTETRQRVSVRLKASGISIADASPRWVTIDPNGTAKTTFAIEVSKPGKAVLFAEAVTEDKKAADAVEVDFPIFAHGARSHSLASGGGSSGSSGVVVMGREGKLDGASLRLDFTPSTAGAIIQGLSYLAVYPWGCVEQTISSFAPDVVVMRTLAKFNAALTSGGLGNVPDMVAKGVRKLRDMQHPDGSWGWYLEPKADQSTTAHALYFLVEAKKAGAAVPNDMMRKAALWVQAQTRQPLPPRPSARDWARAHKNYENMLESRAWLLMAAANAGVMNTVSLEELYARRTDLTTFGLGCLGLAASQSSKTGYLQAIAELLDVRSVKSRNASLMFWRGRDSYDSWSDYAATAMAIRVLMRAGRSSEGIEPAVRWLLTRRDGGCWRNTRETALVCLALVERLEQVRPQDYAFSVFVNGRRAGSFSVKRNDYFSPPRSLIIGGRWLKTGQNIIAVQKQGAGTLFWTGDLSYVTAAEDAAPQLGYFHAKREFFRLRTVKTGSGDFKQTEEPLRGDVRAGEVIRLRISVDAEAEASYVLIDSPLPSGFEAVDTERSWTTSYSGYQLHDEKVGLFARYLGHRTAGFDIDIRAEVPGYLHVMPVEVSAMYSPGMFGRSREHRLVVK